MRRALAPTVVLLALLVATPAGAALPGSDGRVLFSSGGDLHSVLPDGSALQSLTATAGVEEAQAAWSPDGTRVAFRVGSAGTTDVLQIAVMNADGSGRTLVTSGDLHSSQPAWSPDGRQIVFRRSIPGENLSGDIWVMGADGSAPHELLALPGDERYPSLSPDGRLLALTTHLSPLEDVEIAIAPVGGPGVTTLTNNAIFDSSPSWSPDGRRIAFERGPAGDDAANDVWSMAADGSDELRLTTAPGLDEGPSWSPSGARIAFTSTRSGSSDVWTMAADGSDQRPLAALPAGKEESPDWQTVPVTQPGSPVPEPSVTPSPPAPGGAATCPRIPRSQLCDRDRDGLSDARERRLHTSPIDRDSDDDGLSDGREVRRTHTSPRRRDTDRDGLTDGLELGITRGVADPAGTARGTDRRRFRADADPRTHTSPRRRDTDRDGVSDGREDRNHNGRVDPGERDPKRR